MLTCAPVFTCFPSFEVFILSDWNILFKFAPFLSLHRFDSLGLYSDIFAGCIALLKSIFYCIVSWIQYILKTKHFLIYSDILLSKEIICRITYLEMHIIALSDFISLEYNWEAARNTLEYNWNFYKSVFNS